MQRLKRFIRFLKNPAGAIQQGRYAAHFPTLLRIELVTVILIKVLLLTVLWYFCFSTPNVNTHDRHFISQHLLEN